MGLDIYKVKYEHKSKVNSEFLDFLDEYYNNDMDTYYIEEDDKKIIIEKIKKSKATDENKECYIKIVNKLEIEEDLKAF